MPSPACHSQLQAVCVKEQSDKVHRVKFCWLLSLDKGAITDSTYFMYNTPDAKSIQASGLFKCIWWYLEKPVNTSRLDAGCSVWRITSGETIAACPPCSDLPASWARKGGRRTVSFIRSWWSSLALQGARRPQEEWDGQPVCKDSFHFHSCESGGFWPTCQYLLVSSKCVWKPYRNLRPLCFFANTSSMGVLVRPVFINTHLCFWWKMSLSMALPRCMGLLPVFDLIFLYLGRKG